MTTKKKKTPRLPLDALKRIGSRPQTTKKGKKGYDRKREKEVEEKQAIDLFGDKPGDKTR